MSAPLHQNADTAWVLRLAARSWRGWLLISVVTLLTSLLSLLHPWPLKLLLDHVLSGVPLPKWTASIASHLPKASTPLGFAAYVALLGLLLFALNIACDVLLQRQWIRARVLRVQELVQRTFGLEEIE